MKSRHVLPAILVLLSLSTIFGCTQPLTRSSSSAPLSKIIEPVRDSQVASGKAPLTWPVSVAIVTVPSKQHGDRQVPNTILRLASEKLRQQLLACPKYVGTVTVVEQVDFEGKISLQMIRELYGADIAVIVSYQQDQRGSQSGMFGLLDATGVGAFVVPGVQIKTASVIDGKVIHIPSNAIIFRASGTDDRSSHSTSYGVKTSLVDESITGLLAATADFGNSLTRTIAKFDHYDLAKAVTVTALALASTPEDQGPATTPAPYGLAPSNDYWKKVDTYKKTGGGAFSIIGLLMAAATCGAAVRRK